MQLEAVSFHIVSIQHNQPAFVTMLFCVLHISVSHRSSLEQRALYSEQNNNEWNARSEQHYLLMAAVHYSMKNVPL